MKKFRPLYVIFTLMFLFVYGCQKREETKQPVADFNFTPTSNIKTGDLVTFTSLSTDAETFDWDFKDGSTSVSEDPTHTFTTAGTFKVTLLVQNKNLRAEITKDVIVESLAKQPTADFSFVPATSISPGDVVTFTNTSVDAETYEWDFGDGSPLIITQHPNHQFDAAGEYYVTLSVQNMNLRDEITKTVVVENQISLTACFTMSENTTAIGDYIYFTNCSTGADSYEWDFDGDGIIDSYDIEPSFYSNTTGTYYVKLIAISGSATDEYEQSIIIIDPAEYWPTGITAWNTDYFNDFSASGDWYEGTGVDYSLTVANDFYTMVDINDDLDHTGWFVTNDAVILPNDVYDLEVTIRNTVDNGNYGSGLIYDSDGDNFNYFKFSNGSYRIGDNVNGDWKSWTSTTDGNIEDWNKLTVRKYQSRYYFFINEVFLYSDDYSSFGNMFGFGFDKNTTVDITYVGIYSMVFSSKKSGNKKQQINTAHGSVSGKIRNAPKDISPLK